MAQEGMPLTKEIKKKLYDCITGKSTYEKERQKIDKEMELNNRESSRLFVGMRTF